jgi:hypothetical protein
VGSRGLEGLHGPDVFRVQEPIPSVVPLPD